MGRGGRLERESGVRRRRSEPFGAVLEGFGAVFRVVAVAWSESPVCVGGGLSRLERFGGFWSGILGPTGRLERESGVRRRWSERLGAVWSVLERYFGS